VVRKWLFTKHQEAACDDDDAAVELLYAQASWPSLAAFWPF
jgi:hypothetical protein